MKFWRSPFFYFGVIIFCFAISLSFFIGQKKESFSQKRDILDESQFLFSEANLLPNFLDLNIIEGSLLAPSAPPFLVRGKVLGALGDIQKPEVEEYIIESGDTLSGIASQFGISLETLLWANDLSLNSIISPGQKLIILPVSGVLHIIRERDTLSEIAQIYQAKVDEIVDFNELSNQDDIFVGDLLIIPGGEMPRVIPTYTQVPLSQNPFICPIPLPCRITQGLHWFNAIDFGNGKCGEPVFAAAGGTVQRTGYGNVSGYYVRILHPNGVVTFYGHLSKITVTPGQKVFQGQIIGYVGYSGVTSPRGPAGCHLHFDVRFARNPFAGYAVGTELGK
ncbi:M23 family metallopeptidase [Patescibacteria group bacterium]|nr:M23 family metallopeptidase [Patescibacteria group bacterium]